MLCLCFLFAHPCIAWSDCDPQAADGGGHGQEASDHASVRPINTQPRSLSCSASLSVFTPFVLCSMLLQRKKAARSAEEQSALEAEATAELMSMDARGLDELADEEEDRLQREVRSVCACICLKTQHTTHNNRGRRVVVVSALAKRRSTRTWACGATGCSCGRARHTDPGLSMRACVCGRYLINANREVLRYSLDSHKEQRTPLAEQYAQSVREMVKREYPDGSPEVLSLMCC